MYYSFDADVNNLIGMTNDHAPYREPVSWDLYAALIATILNFDAIKKYGYDSAMNDSRLKIIYGSRDNAFVGKRQDKLIIFFGSDYGTLTAEYDFFLKSGGYSYSTSTYSAESSFNDFKGKVDQYFPVNSDNFVTGLQTFASMLGQN